MNKRIKPFVLVRPYEQALSLRWPVTYWLAPEERVCGVRCDPRVRNHEVWLTEKAVREPEDFIGDIVHELCHCALAERADSCFSTVWFSEKLNQTCRENPDFGRFAQMLYLSWSHVDIWVNDLRHSLWPEITVLEHQSLSCAVMLICQREAWDVLSQIEMLLAMAQHQAERIRHGIDSADLFAVLLAHGVKVEEKIYGLAKFFASLPSLKFKQSKDVKTLETSVKEVAQRLEFPIAPKLISEEGIWVWDF